MTTTSPEHLEQKVALQRDQLAQTVDQLSAKLDVKHRAADRVARTPKPVLLAPVVLAVAVVGLVVWRRKH
ncbi:DUF3618 domain-containing protein [Nocardioides marmorisolisilvae]|uniref:DUF3618 domain-containing protein n=1 Tax=Nocardioides marmorisolisilvae TaxID=1542737 RepID=A0A3N0DTE0_9ACTN|nr:DUF3618 domain-containing protein [Nocardioides marmorisolisilvae]RNL78889.1 DUF3618 domain-containing protein [Nocardioides marmorisolisilvae]